MKKNKEEIIYEWYAKADSDIAMAIKAIDFPPIILDGACFHCQQAVEKYLKAYLIYHGKDVVKTHSLDFLIDSISEFDVDFASIDTKDLEDFSVDIRYPDDATAPTLEEAEEYLQIAEAVKELVRKKIVF